MKWQYSIRTYTWVNKMTLTYKPAKTRYSTNTDKREWVRESGSGVRGQGVRDSVRELGNQSGSQGVREGIHRRWQQLQASMDSQEFVWQARPTERRGTWERNEVISFQDSWGAGTKNRPGTKLMLFLQARKIPAAGVLARTTPTKCKQNSYLLPVCWRTH